MTEAPDRSKPIRHVTKTLASVLSRPRFKLTVKEESVPSFFDQSRSELRISVETEFGAKFRVVYREYAGKGDVYVSRFQEDNQNFSHFFHHSFRLKEMPNLRKTAVMMANKMNGSLFADVIDA